MFGYRCIGVGTLLLVLGWTPPSRAACDPVELDKLTTPDGAYGDDFGYRYAVQGDTAIVGALYDDHAGGVDAGSAYVLVRSGGSWSLVPPKLTASDAQAGDRFGISVALDGDTALIGADQYYNAGDLAGAAYVFVRVAGEWSQHEQVKLTADDGAEFDLFGFCVDLQGDTAVISAHRDANAGGIDAGSAYVFIRTDDVWTQAAKLTASDAAAYDYFGLAVAIDGETILVGNIKNDAGGTDSGAAYVFQKPPDGWDDMTETQKLTANDPAAFDYFGFNVALRGETALIGAWGVDGESYDEGAAYVFVRSGDVWSQAAKLTASDADAEDIFGAPVALNGDTALIGAEHDDHAGGTDAGSVYLFQKPPDAWHDMTETAKITASDADANDQFGAVALDGDTAVIGAAFGDSEGGPDTGAVYIFDLGCIECDGDANGDDTVDPLDSGHVLARLGCPVGSGDPECDAADANADCAVDPLDVGYVLARLGACEAPLPHSTDCCTPHCAAGCDDDNIEACVCAVDSSCCEVAWSDECVEFVELLGCGECSY